MGGKHMSWQIEQRKILFEDYKSGKITTEEFDEKVDTLDKLSNNEEQDNTNKILKRRIVLPIILILIAVTCTFLLIVSLVKNEKHMYTEALSSQNEISVPRTSGASHTMNDSHFIELCKTGSLQQINDAIANGANVNAKDKECTPLMAAAGDNTDPRVAKALIKAGADVNVENESGKTPLLLAVMKNSDLEMVSVLIEAGARVNINDSGRKTPLVIAAENKNPNQEIMTVLIKAGADVNVRNKSGLTPLMLVVGNENSDPEMITTLLNFGADPSIEDNVGFTATDHARKNKRLRNSVVIQDLQMEAKPAASAASKRVGSSRTDLTKDAVEDSRFLYLCTNGSLFLINEAVKSGANVNARINGMTPLMAATRRNSSPELIKILVRAGASVNAQDNSKMTPLILAAQFSSNPEVIRILLDYGANPDMEDTNFKKAAHYAMENEILKNTDVRRRLIEGTNYGKPGLTPTQARRLAKPVPKP
jgi:ankyrin repeat protein